MTCRRCTGAASGVAAPIAPALKAGLLVMTTLGLLAVGAAAWYVGTSRRGSLTLPLGGGPQGLLNGQPGGARSTGPTRRSRRTRRSSRPISARRIGVIDTFKDNPSDEWLKTIAGRLAETEPTEEQKKKHEDWKKKKALLETKACPKEACDEAAKLDDVLIVSRGLKKIKPGDLQAQKNLVKALQKWGTEENVPQLIELTEAGGYGEDAVRIGACKALSQIPIRRGPTPSPRVS